MASTVDQNFEQVSYSAPGLSQHKAAARKIIGDGVATRTLTAKESGSLCLHDLAAGVVYTLPTPAIGMFFDFATTVTITSNSAKVLTNLSTELLLGNMLLANSAATTGEAFLANGTTHRSVNGNGTTTGGIAGDSYRLTAISSTQWLVSGVMSQTGTAATPFATS
jgi:hypothetical protein